MARPIDEGRARAGAAAGLLLEAGHQARVLILLRLSGGEAPAGELERAAGLSQSAANYHLNRLRATGVIEGRRAGQGAILYSLTDRGWLLLKAIWKAFDAVESQPTEDRGC